MLSPVNIVFGMVVLCLVLVFLLKVMLMILHSKVVELEKRVEALEEST